MILNSFQLAYSIDRIVLIILTDTEIIPRPEANVKKISKMKEMPLI